MTQVQISAGRMREAEAIARQIPATLERRGLRPVFANWLVTEDDGATWLFGVLDTAQIGRMERYTDAKLLHQLSTNLGGRPVFLSNSSGLRYAVLLSRPPTLPGRVDLPGIERGAARIGVRYTRGEVRPAWDRMGHLLVAGMTGSGKSNFLRLLAYQAVMEEMQILAADVDQTTLPMLAGHRALGAPLARTADEALDLVEMGLAECDRRAGLYAESCGFPENLGEYNRVAREAGAERLPRMLVILDEFNAMVTSAGGARGTLAGRVADLGWRGRKFGINLVLAAQDFAKSVVGRVRDQMGAVVCFRVRNPDTARAVGVEDAAQMKQTRPGLAVTDRWGVVQTYYLDKELLIQVDGQVPLTGPERALIDWAQRLNDGYMTLAAIEERLEMSQYQARRLAEDWETRGWLEKDTTKGNARRMTERLRSLVAMAEGMR